ncbi:alpha/beta fold hydrolase [Cytobacillus sp. Hm23]
MWVRRFINTPRGQFEVFTQGKGEQICITHLYSEFNELGYYFADTFVEDFTVFLINLKEAGNSSITLKEEELSMLEAIKDLEAIRDSLNIERWCFAGHSSGGMLGLMYTTIYPNSIKKLMVGGAAATNQYIEHKDSMYCPHSHLNKKLKRIFSILKSPTSTIDERKVANKEWTNMSLFNIERRDEYFTKPSSGQVVQRRLDYFSFKEIPDYDIRNELKLITIPTFVFCGRYDTQCPLIFSEEISKCLTNSTLYIFDLSNHFPFIEEKEKFLEIICDFKNL